MDAFKRSLDSDDMEEISNFLKVENDDTIIILYQRGELSQALSDEKSHNNDGLKTTRIRHNSVF